LLSLYVTEATASILSYCQVNDFGLRVEIEILSGSNTPALVLRQLPIQSLAYTGNVTSASTVVSGMSSTAGLFASQSVFSQLFPAGTTIASVDSSSQVTLSQAATTSGTGATLAFGVAVWKDWNALGGSAYTAFASSSALLQEGSDYWVDYQQGPGSACWSGLVNNANGYWVRPSVWKYGLITRQPGPATGSIKVQYAAGFPTIPSDLQMACELLIAKARRSRLYGESVQSTGYEGASTSLASRQFVGLITPEIGALLGRYKVIPF
jgi:hypothetical protein